MVQRFAQAQLVIVAGQVVEVVEIEVFTKRRQNSMPRTLLPTESSRGDQVQKPMTLGITTMIAPETPLLAGRPILKANSPEKSYMPQAT